MSSDSTAPDRDVPLTDHPVAEHGIHCSNSKNPVTLRSDGPSFIQNHPTSVRNILDLEAGIAPTIFIHPEINGVTYIYE